jgi:hypothetical protein
VNLKELRLAIASIEFGPSLSPRYVTSFPRLTVLRVNVAIGSRSDGVSILNYLELPALEVLDVTNARDSSTTVIWKGFFQRHSHIKALMCHGIAGAPLRAALDQLPLLRRLVMRADSTSMIWLFSCMRRSLFQDEAWLPWLEYLGFEEVDQETDLQYLFDFLLSRRRHGNEKSKPLGLAAVNSVEVQFLAGSREGDRAEKLVYAEPVRTLRQSGMRVTIGSRTL